MSDRPQTISQPITLRPGEWIVAGLSVLVVLFFLLSPHDFVLGKLDAVAYAVCHRLPEHSFFFGDQQFPLCARCTGTFTGVLLTMATLTLVGRTRASRLPPPRVLLILVGFFLLWAFDGINSFLTLYPGAPHLYEPQNWLRLTTGMLNGLAIGTLVFSIFSFSLWQDPHPQPVIRGAGELGGLVALAALMTGLILTRDERLFYPLALISTLGIVVELTSINTVIVLIASRRENSARRWRDAVWPLLVALALSLTIVMGIGAGRAALTDALNLPL